MAPADVPNARSDQAQPGVDASAMVAPDAGLGDGVNIGAGAIVESAADLADGVLVNVGAVIGRGVRIGGGVIVGRGAVVSPSVEVGLGAVINDGAVVTRAVPRNAVVEGNPAVIIGYVGLDGPEPMKPVRHQAPTSRAHHVVDTAVGGVQLHWVPEVRDLRGALVAGELGQQLPFVPQRYFMVFNVPTAEVRGEHAHHQCHQYLTAVEGTVHVIADDGRRRQEFVLDEERMGLYLPPKTWGVQYRYSHNCKLLVMASHPYDNADYIRDYGRFLEVVGVAAE